MQKSVAVAMVLMALPSPVHGRRFSIPGTMQEQLTSDLETSMPHDLEMKSKDADVKLHFQDTEPEVGVNDNEVKLKDVDPEMEAISRVGTLLEEDESVIDANGTEAKFKDADVELHDTEPEIEAIPGVNLNHADKQDTEAIEWSTVEHKRQRSLVQQFVVQSKFQDEANRNCQKKAANKNVQIEDCGPADKSLLLLGSSGMPGKVRLGFDELVEKLIQRSNGAKKSVSDLNVLVFYDPAVLRDSFWNQANSIYQNSEAKGAMTADALSFKDNVEKFRAKALEYKPEELDKSWSYNENAPGMNAFEGLGFQKISQISLVERMATLEEFKLMLEIQAGKSVDKHEIQKAVNAMNDRETPEDLKTLIEDADVIAVSGGNPDVVGFVFRSFSKVQEQLLTKVSSGKAIYWGRSAGAMVASANFGLTLENTPSIFHQLLEDDCTGMGLTPKCAVRPHYKSTGWQTVSLAYELSSGLHVARVANGQALQCLDGCCFLLGDSKAADVHEDPHIARLNSTFTSSAKALTDSTAPNKKTNDQLAKDKKTKKSMAHTSSLLCPVSVALLAAVVIGF